MSDTLTAAAVEATTTPVEGPQRNGVYGTYLPIVSGGVTVLAEALDEALKTGVGARELLPFLAAAFVVGLGKHAQAFAKILRGGTYVVTAPSADPNIPDGEAPAEPVQ